MGGNATQRVPLCMGMASNGCFPVARSGAGVKLLLNIFTDLIVVIQLFRVPGSDQNIGGFDLGVTAIFFEGLSKPRSFL